MMSDYIVCSVCGSSDLEWKPITVGYDLQCNNCCEWVDQDTAPTKEEYDKNKYLAIVQT